MDHNLLHLSARIRAFCIALALLLLPGAMQAEDVYLLTAENINGTTGSYNVPNGPSNHQFTNTSGSVYTYTITSMPATGFSFRIGVKGWKNNMQPYQNDDPLTINGASYKIQDGCYGEKNAWKVSYTKGEYKSLTITVDLSSHYVKITGEKSSTGGGTSTTTVNQPGIYLYGSDFGATSSTAQLHYKFVRKNDSEYHFALYAGYMQFSVPQYGASNTNITPSWNGKSFTIAYIDADGKFSTFCPSGNYTLTGSDTNAANAKDFGSNTQWTIQNNGGMYDLVVKVDADGKPTSWYYQSDPNRLVAYKASSTSNWTTEGFLYCVKDANNEATAYFKNFFGTTPMVKNEEFKFILGNYWFGKRNDSETYDQSISIGNGSTDAPNLKNPYDGIYPIEFNPDRDYILGGKDKTPLRIFMVGSALNSSLSNTYTDWNPADATELVYDPDEQCYKGTVSLAKGKQFRFLRDKNASGSATSLDLNFGEDGNVPGATGSTDTDNNNYVAYNGSSASGKNITFNPETNTYNVRFYIEAGTNMNGFTWDAAKFRYTIELPARLNATITPTAATVNYAASLTPKVSVVGTTATKRKYAFTIDGSDPTIDAATGNGTGTTVVRDYDYDPVVPTNDVYTFYMSSADQLTYIDLDGNEHTLKGNTVTVKAQAVQTLTEGSKYRLEGDIATGTYVFKTAGIKPETGSYTISVTNDNQTDKPSINKVTATVTVKNEKGEDDGVDVFYTIDGSDPAKVGNAGARLVKNRKIEVYGIAYLKQGEENRIRVAIAGSKPLEGKDIDNGTTHASCPFDLTCSTSEGGYKTYRENNTDTNLKIYGGDGHIVVYIMPWTSKYGTKNDDGRIWVQSSTQDYQSPDDTPIKENNVKGFRVPFIYAYENIVNKDGVVESKALTHATHTIDVFTDQAEGLPTQKNKDNADAPDYNWHYVDLVPDKDYKEVNLEVGYYDLITGKWEFTPATIANVHNDMFLMYDVATGQIKDVTHEFTGDHFYTIGEGGTKSEAANPAIGEHFFYAQVPEAWTINGNSVKVLQKDGTMLSDDNVKVQGSAETSCLSKVCKITVPESITEGTSLTIQPYHGDKASGQKWTVNYVNGGYYFYESATHYTTNAPLVFSADATGDHDQRPKGHLDINHTMETTPGVRVKKIGYRAYGDCTYYLTPDWTYTPTTESPTITVKDNWNGKEATVNTIAKGTTISQTVEGLPTEGNQYTVQMIVRGTEGAKATLQLEGSLYYDTNDEGEDVPVGNASPFVSKTFAGYDAQGTVTTDGRVEHLLKTDTKNGWQKLETVASVGEGGTLTISLKAEGGDLQLSDVTLLCNANTPPVTDESHPDIIPTIWTSAPTNNDVTEYDLTDRRGANAFSFFDRGDNRNAVIYADKNTVLGMSKNTYNVAVTNASTNAKGSLFSKESSSVSSGVEPGYTMNKLVLTDQAQDGTTDAEGKGTAAFYADAWKYHVTKSFTTKAFGLERHYNQRQRSTICLPIALNSNEIATLFGQGTKVSDLTSVDVAKYTIDATEVTAIEADHPYIIEVPQTYNFGTVDVTYNVAATPDDPSKALGGYTFYSNYEQKTIYYNDKEKCYNFGAAEGGRFYRVMDEGVAAKPFRGYIKADSSSSKATMFTLNIVDDTTTGITDMQKKAENSDAPVYTLSGVKVADKSSSSLAPGIYIQNGKKIIVK